MHIAYLWLMVASVMPSTLAIPFPNLHEPTNTTLPTDTHPLEARAQNPERQCKFSLHNLSGKCPGTTPPAGGVAIALGSESTKPFRNDPLGQQIGGASPCYNVTKSTKSAMNAFWLTDNACAHADKSRYDVIAVFDSSDCRASGKRVQFDIASTWARNGEKGFCKKVDFNVRGIQLWQWLPATLPGQLVGTGL